MLISVPVLSDRLKSKQALPWAPLPNSRQSNTSIKKKASSPASPQFSRFPPPFVFLAALLILPCRPFSNRHCLHRSNTLSPYIHTCTYRITSHTLPPPPTRPCFVSLGGLAAIEPSVPFANRAIYKQYMDAVHTPTFHPPTLSLTSLPQTHNHLCEEFQYARKLHSGVMACSFSHLFQRMYPVYLRMQVRHPRLGWMRLLCQPEEKKWWDLTRMSGGL